MIRISIFFLLSFLTASAYSKNILITDSNGKLEFEKSPTRVVVINWTLAEQIIELGITPVGIADIKGYSQQIVQPKVPADAIDVGTREAPKLKVIRDLKPDLIVVGYSQRPLIRTLSNIATVLYFNNFSKRFDNEEKSRERFLELARVFDKEAFARNKLIERDQKITALKSEIKRAYGNALPKISILVPHGDHHAWVFGNNSMPHYAAKMLGLQSELEFPKSKLGANKIKMSKLENIEGCLLIVSYEKFDLHKWPAWQNFSQSNDVCVSQMSSTAAYGGAMSILYLAEAISESLLKTTSN